MPGLLAMPMAAATAVLWAAWPAQAAALVEMPMDNSRSPFREDSSYFAKPWPPIDLIDGSAGGGKLRNDLVLHNGTAYGLSSAWALLYPWEWENDFENQTLCALSRRYWWASYVAASLYLVGLWVGTYCMKDKKPYNLKGLLAVWNLFLAVFSLIGAVRTAPHLFYMLNVWGFNYTLCRAAIASYGHGPVGLWATFFIYSKYFELIDTVFLVLRKKKVGFLHWYHHCSVLLYCWHAFVWEMPTGIYFVAMNYSVHAVMYFYYFLAAVMRPPNWALMVTIMQLAQMAIGIAITLSHLRIIFSGSVARCDGHVANLSAALAMYASYFVLFAQFLAQRYCGRRDASSKIKKVE